jgi:uncharacterized RDD family membrane protein YckC
MSAFKLPTQGGLNTSERRERAHGLAAPLRHRMAALIYEGVLLFGLTWGVGMVYSISTHQQHSLLGRDGMLAVQFLALSVYFLWFWTHGGQTLAMKTWHLQLVSDQGLPLPLRQALKRFLASWLWVLPPCIGVWMTGLLHSHGLKGGVIALGLWLLTYTSLTKLLPQGQFLHDVICRTRLIDTRP